jgi:hypothetical protein
MMIIRPGPSSPATNTSAITGCNRWDRPDGKGLSTLVIDPSKRQHLDEMETMDDEPLLGSMKDSYEAHRLEENAITSNDQGKR